MNDQRIIVVFSSVLIAIFSTNMSFSYIVRNKSRLPKNIKSLALIPALFSLFSSIPVVLIVVGIMVTTKNSNLSCLGIMSFGVASLILSIIKILKLQSPVKKLGPLYVAK